MMSTKKHTIILIIITILYALIWNFIIINDDFLKNVLGLQFIYHEHLDFFNTTLFIFKSMILVLIVYYLVLTLSNIKHSQNRMKYFTRFYILVLAYLLIIKGFVGSFYFSLTPADFQYASFRLDNIIELQEIANILLFIPLPIVVYNYTHNYIILGLLFLLSPLVELIQLGFNIGQFDIMDIIYNTIGLIIGFVILFIVNNKKIIE